MDETNTQTQLTLSMLETLFRGHDFSDTQCHVLPNGEYLTNTELRTLFESYVQ